MDRQSPLQTLMLKFESIGDNCEFGLVQRKAGVEPLGLFRFSGHTFDQLRRALQSGFQDFAADMGLYVNGAEIVTHARKYDFHFHTFLAQDVPKQDELLLKETARIKFLQRRVLEDLASGEKIFLRKSNVPPSDEDIDGLFDDINAYGRNSLLWVTASDAEHPHGSVEVLASRLMMGYVDRLAPYDDAHRIDYDSWFELCAKAFRIAEGAGRASSGSEGGFGRTQMAGD